MKLLFAALRIIGFLILVAALLPAWFAYDDLTEANKLDNEITKSKAALARGGPPAAQKNYQDTIDQSERDIGKKKTQAYLLFGAAAGGLILGAGLLLFPAPKKRKSSAAQVPPSNPE